MLTINMKIDVLSMLIVGEVSNQEEQMQLRFIAQVFIIEQRFKYLARQNKRKQN